MKYSDIISFRDDLLFDGAVQIGWFERNESLAKKASEHFIFHGPLYHGITRDDSSSAHSNIIDTASFTLDILNRLNTVKDGSPFKFAIAGYGTGKSHLGLTLATLLKNPKSKISKKIVDNIAISDKSIGSHVKQLITDHDKPFIVVTINGMDDFNLCDEIIRQILKTLEKSNHDISPLQKLRPRFKTAEKYVDSFFDFQKDLFKNDFSDSVRKEDIMQLLRNQDEETFSAVSRIHEKSIGNPIPVAGQEAFNSFISTAKDNYCGIDKPFAGIVILFDEFGRYMEFAVQKPHVAGSGALQQIFEAIQENSEGVFLIGFIQYEIKAYISRIAPELREDLNRYVSRYDIVSKVRLSTNLETLIANLFEKKNPQELEKQISSISRSLDNIQTVMLQYFPEINNHALWLDEKQFKNIIIRGCWPLHPLSTWALYKLSSVGKSLQQRSAFSFLAHAFNSHKDKDYSPGSLIWPTELCNESMINEFISSEEYGQQGATAHAYESVTHKYKHELSPEQIDILKAILLSSKIGYKVSSRIDCINLLSMFCGLNSEKLEQLIKYLESDLAVLEWNENLHRFEISGDSVPKKAFLAHLTRKTGEIESEKRGELFSQHYAKWSETTEYNTDFANKQNISTKDWHYKTYYSCYSILESQIIYAIETWKEARKVDEYKGQLIYCYISSESTIENAKNHIRQIILRCMNGENIPLNPGAPIAVILLHDIDGLFGQKIADKWVLLEKFNEEEKQKYKNFILDRVENLNQDMRSLFKEMEMKRNIVFASEKQIKESRIKNMLTELFEKIYSECIPFPFDGFATERGNAATDCLQFMRQLFVGKLDREWVSTLIGKQKSRAYKVFDESWGVFEDDGSVKIKSKNPIISKIISLLESKLFINKKPESNKPLILGDALRILCSPPYGCNLASAGLILSLFIGKRKDELNIFYTGKPLTLEQYLDKSIIGKFFDINILDDSFITPIDRSVKAEWERLLEKWHDEKKLSIMCDYMIKAEKMNNIEPIPQSMHYKLKYLEEKTKIAVEILNRIKTEKENAISKIEKGLKHSDIGKISWGAKDLSSIKDEMQASKELWKPEEIDELDDEIIFAKNKIKDIFDQWILNISFVSAEQLYGFRSKYSKILGNLEELELKNEYNKLESLIQDFESNIQLIEAIIKASTNIKDMSSKIHITENTPVSEIHDYLKQANQFERILSLKEKSEFAVKVDIEEPLRMLAELRNNCNEQLKKHTLRTERIYDIENLSNRGDIEYLRSEIAALMKIFAGRDRDLEDLKLVIKQIDLVEMHINKLNDPNLNMQNFNVFYNTCINETKNSFGEDDPPLNYKRIYNKIKKEILLKRSQDADEWIKQNLPELDKLVYMQADEIMSILNILKIIPNYLSEGQTSTVRKAIIECEKRLDDLEVEGAIAKFKQLSRKNQLKFLEQANNIIKDNNKQ